MKTTILLLVSSFMVFSLTVCADETPDKATAVFKPTFMTGYDSFSGGTAFVCRAPQSKSVLLVTALHLFGPACGLDEQYSPEDVLEVFPAVTGLSMVDRSVSVTSTAPVELKNTNVSDDDGCAGDMVAYMLGNEAVEKPFRLARSPSKVGDRVFLIARQRGSERLERLEAHVVESDGNNLIYRFEKTELATAGTSGAPVLNESGEVVGMNVSGGEHEGKQYGYANPVSSMSVALGESGASDTR